MAKILITRDGVLERTVQLNKERMSIGRHGHNDIVLDHPTVSGEHAAITTILDDSFLEDLYSTNGTFVNGHRIGKHFLQHQDQVKLAKYRIEFVKDGIRPLSGIAAALDVASVAAAAVPAAQAAAAPVPVAAAAATVPSLVAPPATIEVLNGSNAGKKLALNKPHTSLGRAGVQVVLISRTDTGYAAAHAEGERIPLLNGTPLGTSPRALADGDVLDLSGIHMAFRQG